MNHIASVPGVFQRSPPSGIHFFFCSISFLSLLAFFSPPFPPLLTGVISCAPDKVFTSLNCKEVKALLGKGTYPVTIDLHSQQFNLDSDRFVLNCPDVVKELYLENNSISIVSSFPHFSKLQVLVIDNNQVQTLSLKGLSSLVHLSAQHNRISSLQDVKEMKKLVYMNLADNNLKTVVDDWSKFRHLRVLDLSGNPLADPSSEQLAIQIEAAIKKMAAALRNIEYLAMNDIPNIKQTMVIKWVLTNFKKLNFYNWMKITKNDRETKTMSGLSLSSDIVASSGPASGNGRTLLKNSHDQLEEAFNSITSNMAFDDGEKHSAGKPKERHRKKKKKHSHRRRMDGSLTIRQVNDTFSNEMDALRSMMEQKSEIGPTEPKDYTDEIMKELEFSDSDNTSDTDEDETKENIMKDLIDDLGDGEKAPRGDLLPESGDEACKRKSASLGLVPSPASSPLSVLSYDSDADKTFNTDSIDTDDEKKEKREMDEKELMEERDLMIQRQQNEECSSGLKQVCNVGQVSSDNDDDDDNAIGNTIRLSRTARDMFIAKTGSVCFSPKDEPLPDPSASPQVLQAAPVDVAPLVSEEVTVNSLEPERVPLVSATDNENALDQQIAPEKAPSESRESIRDEVQDTACIAVPSEPWKIGSQEIELVELINEGTFGESYLAKKIRNREAIVKALRPQCFEPDYVSAVTKEVMEVLKIEHQLFSPYIGICVEKTFCVCSEYQRGYSSLKKLIGDHLEQLNVVARAKIAMSIVLGLMHLHTKGMTFGLLRSTDVLVNPSNWSVKFITYGLPTTKIAALRMGVIFDPEYVAPEILASEEKRADLFTKEADVYALGMLLWELFEGGFSHFHPDPETAVRGFSFEDRHFTKTPMAFISLIQRTSSSDPKERPTIIEFGKAFKQPQDEVYVESCSGLSLEQAAQRPKLTLIVRRLIEVLSIPSADAALKGVSGIRQLVKQPHGAAMLIEAGLINVVLTSPALPIVEVTEAVMTLFAELAELETFCKAFVERCNGFKVLGKYLSNPSTEVVSKVLECVINVLPRIKLTQDSLVDQNFVTSLVALMKGHMTPVPVLLHAYTVATKLAKVQELRHTLLSLFGISDVVRAIQAAVTPVKCKAICLLGEYMLEELREERKLAAVLLKLVESPNPEVVKAVCKALSVCTESDGFLDVISPKQYILPLVKIFISRGAVPSLEADSRWLKHVARALRALCVDDDCADYCQSIGVLAKCNVMLKEQHVPFDSSTAAILMLMQRLFSCPTCRDNLSDVGGAAPLLSIISRCSSMAKVKSAALRACATLAEDPS